MAKDYSQEFLNISKQFYDVSARQAEVLSGVQKAIEEINHNNVLHIEAEQRTAAQIDQLALSLSDFKKFFAEHIIGLIVQVFRWIVIALIVLAGVRAATSLFAH